MPGNTRGMDADEIVAVYRAETATVRAVAAPRWLGAKWPSPPAYKRKQAAWQRAAFALRRAKSSGRDASAVQAEHDVLRRAYLTAKRSHDRWLKQDVAWMAYYKAFSERMTARCGPGWPRILDKALRSGCHAFLADQYKRRVRAHDSGFLLPSASPGG